VSRKFLSSAWGTELEAFLATDWPVLCRYHGLGKKGPKLEPPAPKGSGQKALFLFFDQTAFRKGLKQLSGSTSTDIRGAVEQYLLETKADRILVSKRSLQNFVAHSGQISQRHYWRKDSAEISNRLHALYHG